MIPPWTASDNSPTNHCNLHRHHKTNLPVPQSNCIYQQHKFALTCLKHQHNTHVITHPTQHISHKPQNRRDQTIISQTQHTTTSTPNTTIPYPIPQLFHKQINPPWSWTYWCITAIHYNTKRTAKPPRLHLLIFIAHRTLYPDAIYYILIFNFISIYITCIFSHKRVSRTLYNRLLQRSHIIGFSTLQTLLPLMFPVFREQDDNFFCIPSWKYLCLSRFI